MQNYDKTFREASKKSAYTLTFERGTGGRGGGHILDDNSSRKDQWTLKQFNVDYVGKGLKFLFRSQPGFRPKNGQYASYIIVGRRRRKRRKNVATYYLKAIPSHPTTPLDKEQRLHLLTVIL